jgi:hypothetical protein
MAENEIRSVEPPPSQQADPLLYRMVVGALGLALLLMVVGGLVLSGMGQQIPDGLIALGAASGGALGGLLAPAPMQR